VTCGKPYDITGKPCVRGCDSKKNVTVRGEFRNVRFVVRMFVRVMSLCSTLDFDVKHVTF
jgi:hypothetical protein